MTSLIMLATGNPGKAREIKQIMATLDVQIVLPSERGLVLDVEETGSTYLENALLKAQRLVDLTGLPALADDSGLEVDALNGRPGVHSARYAGRDASDDENNEKLAAELGSSESRSARYRCVAVLALPGGRSVWAEATCEGSISEEPRGSGGFGYDPWFIPLGRNVTMAELAPEEKDEISHRGKAFRELAAKMTSLV